MSSQMKYNNPISGWYWDKAEKLLSTLRPDLQANSDNTESKGFFDKFSLDRNELRSQLISQLNITKDMLSKLSHDKRLSSLFKKIQSQLEKINNNQLNSFFDKLANHNPWEKILKNEPFYHLMKLIHDLEFSQNILWGIWAIRDKLVQTIPSTIDSQNIETIWKILSGFKTPLAIILFFTSALTTFRWVNEYLSLVDHLQWSSTESIRYMISWATWLWLSSAILDFKKNIFSSIAVEWWVLKWIKEAFINKPWLMGLYLLLTIISIKTNYDWAVSVISKADNLQWQSQTITKKVNKALWNWDSNGSKVESLSDLNNVLQIWIADAIRKFHKIPIDEAGWRASSWIAKCGPRCKAKNIVVHSGDQVIHTDSSSSWSAAETTREINEIFFSNNFDTNRSIGLKLFDHVQSYNWDFEKTKSEIGLLIKQLEELTTFHEYSIAEFIRWFGIEGYQIDSIRKQILDKLVANKEKYEQNIKAINKMIEQYKSILTKIDKAWWADKINYKISIDFPNPNLSAIEALNWEIPPIKQMTLSELEKHLHERHWTFWASMYIWLILLWAILTDLADPVLYGRGTAKRWTKDKFILATRKDQLQDSEDKYIDSIESFLQSSDLSNFFWDIEAPSRFKIQVAFYKVLEKIDPKLKHKKDMGWFKRKVNGFVWFFQNDRDPEIYFHNRKVKAINKFIENQDKYILQLVSLLFPWVNIEKWFKWVNLDQINIKINNNTNTDNENMAFKLETLSKEYYLHITEAVSLFEHEIDKLRKRRQEVERQLAYNEGLVDKCTGEQKTEIDRKIMYFEWEIVVLNKGIKKLNDQIAQFNQLKTDLIKRWTIKEKGPVWKAIASFVKLFSDNSYLKLQTPNLRNLMTKSSIQMQNS